MTVRIRIMYNIRYVTYLNSWSADLYFSVSRQFYSRYWVIVNWFLWQYASWAQDQIGVGQCLWWFLYVQVTVLHKQNHSNERTWFSWRLCHPRPYCTCLIRPYYANRFELQLPWYFFQRLRFQSFGLLHLCDQFRQQHLLFPRVVLELSPAQLQLESLASIENLCPIEFTKKKFLKILIEDFPDFKCCLCMLWYFFLNSDAWCRRCRSGWPW